MQFGWGASVSFKNIMLKLFPAFVTVLYTSPCCKQDIMFVYVNSVAGLAVPDGMRSPCCGKQSHDVVVLRASHKLWMYTLYTSYFLWRLRRSTNFLIQKGSFKFEFNIKLLWTFIYLRKMLIGLKCLIKTMDILIL